MTNLTSQTTIDQTSLRKCKRFLAAVRKFDIFRYIYEVSYKLVIMCSPARAFAARIYERIKREMLFLSHFQAKTAPSSLCQCTASPEL